MCLYPILIKNPHWKGKEELCRDKRKLYVPASCGRCIECRRKKIREWRFRIEWESRTNKNIPYFITLTFTDEALDRLPSEPHAATSKAIERFRKLWDRKYHKAPRYWFVNELGDSNTERLHIHGIMWEPPERLNEIPKLWEFGEKIDIQIAGEGVVPYVSKYILKPDEAHPDFYPKVYASKGIGRGFLKSETAKQYTREGSKARQYIKMRDGSKIDIPMYFRRKLFTDAERDNMWTKLLDKQERYVMGKHIDVKDITGQIEYYKTLQFEQRRTERMGYPKKPWDKKKYEKTRKNLEKSEN